LTWSDFKLRYKNSALDFFWSLLEPLLMLVVLYVVFSNLMRVQVEHYQLFLLLGIILWNFIDRGTSLEHMGDRRKVQPGAKSRNNAQRCRASIARKK
jgi:lipopolysaccharide transport system permease protein